MSQNLHQTQTQKLTRRIRSLLQPCKITRRKLYEGLPGYLLGGRKVLRTQPYAHVSLHRWDFMFSVHFVCKFTAM
jgi:hypothetical protein